LINTIADIIIEIVNVNVATKYRLEWMGLEAVFQEVAGVINQIE